MVGVIWWWSDLSGLLRHSSLSLGHSSGEGCKWQDAPFHHSCLVAWDALQVKLDRVFNMIFLVVTGMLGEHHFVWLCHLHQPALEHGIERFLGWVAMDLDFFKVFRGFTSSRILDSRLSKKSSRTLNHDQKQEAIGLLPISISSSFSAPDGRKAVCVLQERVGQVTSGGGPCDVTPKRIRNDKKNRIAGSPTSHVQLRPRGATPQPTWKWNRAP